MTTQDIIKKICEINGDNLDAINANLYNIKRELGKQNADIWLRGWFSSPETLKAVFGDKDTCFMCGSQEVDAGKSFNGEVTEYSPTCKKCGANWMDKAEFPVEGNYIPAWEWHGKEMVSMSLEEILQYYGQYL